MDIEYLLALQNLRESLPDFVSTLANGVTVLGIVLPLVIGVFAYWVFDREFGLLVVGGTCLANFVVQSVKLVFCVYRPWVLDSRIVPYAGAMGGASGYSFPSGHSTLASASCGSVAWGWRKRRVLCACFVVLALLCAFTRNMLGVHTPQDVLAGLTVGVVSVAVAAIVFPWIEKGQRRDIGFFVVCAVLSVVAMIFFSVKDYPLDYANGALLVDPADMVKDGFTGAGILFGFAAGYLFERRVVHHVTRGWSGRALGCALVGVACTGILYVGLGKLCALALPVLAATFVKVAVVLFFAVGVWPAAMQRFAWPDAPQTDASRPEASQPAASQPNMSRPDAPQTDASQSVASRPGSAQPGVTE